ncbi:O-antigen ligase family protein [Lusitaniella coriacea]|uniref:O-antigen ligase family protein n=1 Tax=Lusitaniella coriacea TaxID=1983105 RepID=UPI003CF79AE2
MKRLYTGLFSLSILLINPWGNSRGTIWTQPKISVLLLIVILNLVILLEARGASHKPINPSRSGLVCLLLWGLFLTSGLISTLRSPAPFLSLLGQEQMGDGWLYWLLVASFTLTNSLLLKQHPQLLRAQLEGLILGGFLLALSVFPQVFDWRIDYTTTTGQLLQSDILASTIFRNQQPIGLYSHRGHAAFVLATVGLLVLVARRWGWFSQKRMVILLVPIALALFCTQTRAGIVTLLAGTAYLLRGRYDKRWVVAVLVGLLVVGGLTVRRHIANISTFDQAVSGRGGMVSMAVRGIQQRPLWGWGFDGFGIAYPWIHNPTWTPQVVRIDSFSFTHQRRNGEQKKSAIPTFKAHNGVLDVLLSVGFVGVVLYGSIWVYYLRLVWQESRLTGIEVIALAYFVFTLIWFECAQFTHLVWWMLSLWGVKEKST